jgi:prolyl oligopeptidase family protein
VPERTRRPSSRISAPPYVDPVFATDSDPVWSGDGSHISFVRRVAGVPDEHATRDVSQLGRWTPPPGRAGDTYRLHDLLAAPIAYTPVRSGDGRSLAYITWEATERAIYFMRAGDRARRIVHHPGDDGLDLSQLDVSREGGALAYVRGGAPNSRGEVPNPRSLPDPPERQVWIAGTQDVAHVELLAAEPEGCAVIFPHGGPRRAMLPGFHYYDTYSNLYEMNQYLASHGCVVLSVDYRGGIMHGNAFRIGIHGLSWGGYIVALALARDSDMFKVGFDMAGTHAAPIAEVDGWESPVMLVQGDDDRNVNFSHGVNLVQALMTRRPQVELAQRVFPNEVHDLYLTYEDLVDTYVPGAYFLLDRLQN